MQTDKLANYAFSVCSKILNELNLDGGLIRIFRHQNADYVQWHSRQFIYHAWKERVLEHWWLHNQNKIYQNFDWMEDHHLDYAQFNRLPSVHKSGFNIRENLHLHKWKCRLLVLNHELLKNWYAMIILPGKSNIPKAEFIRIAESYSSVRPDLSASDQFAMPSQTNQKQSEISSGNLVRLTHDLRKPLNNLILNHAKLSKSLNLSDEELLQNPEIIKSALKRFGIQLKQMESFTWDLLHLGTDNLPESENLVSFSFHEMITEILLGFEDSLRMHKIKIINDWGNDFIITQNKNHVYRILYNLISNAWQYCSSPGKIYIDLKTRGKWMKIDIEDSGKNNNLADDSFELSKINIGRGGGGWGIGLVSSMNLAQSIGGKLQKKPSKYGKGLHFLLVLPDKKINDDRKDYEPDHSTKQYG